MPITIARSDSRQPDLGNLVTVCFTCLSMAVYKGSRNFLQFWEGALGPLRLGKLVR